MPVDFNSSLNKISSKAFGSPLLNNMVSSVFSLSFLISMSVVVLIMFIYPAKPGTPAITLLRLTIYIFFSTTALVFLHDGVKMRQLENITQREDDNKIMQGITSKNKDLYEIMANSGQKNDLINSEAAPLSNEKITSAKIDEAKPDEAKPDEAKPDEVKIPDSPASKNLGNKILGGVDSKGVISQSNMFKEHLRQLNI